MQRTALTLLGALLISGLAVQLAAASEHHHRSKAYFGRYLPEYYLQSGGRADQCHPASV